MPSKYEITKNAAEWLKTEVLSSQPKYLAFLRTAANNYNTPAGKEKRASITAMFIGRFLWRRTTVLGWSIGTSTSSSQKSWKRSMSSPRV